MDPEEAMSLFWEHYPVNMEVREFCTQLVLGTLDRLTIIDELLSAASENWSLTSDERGRPQHLETCHI